MTERHVAELELKPFIRPTALAELLDLSERTVRQMLADHVIASYRIAGQRRIAWEDVDRFLAERREERR